MTCDPRKRYTKAVPVPPDGESSMCLPSQSLGLRLALTRCRSSSKAVQPSILTADDQATIGNRG
jgi:hypothetical protein